MKTVSPGLGATRKLYAATHYYRKGDFASAQRALGMFLAKTEAMRHVRVGEILPNRGLTIRLMARLQSDDGTDHFLKISKKSDEYQFFRNADALKRDLEKHDIHIVWPSVAIRTPTLAGMLFPYHDFMLAEQPPFDLPAICAAIAKMNSSGRSLRRAIGASTQQRRTVFLLNLFRRTVLSRPFLRNERDVFMRTVRAMTRYRRLQASTQKVFCQGDIKKANLFQQNGATYIIDFGNYFFAEPGLDLARLYKGSEKRLNVACAAYTDAFDGPVAQNSLRLAVLYGHFLQKLRCAIHFGESAEFRIALQRLEAEMDRNF